LGRQLAAVVVVVVVVVVVLVVVVVVDVDIVSLVERRGKGKQAGHVM
jgi:hypothetical protein